MTPSVTTNNTTVAVGNPFVGLKAFSKEDKSFFFGRDKEVKEVLRKFKSTRLLAVVGPAGSGKSSMMKAGIIPKLEDGYEGQDGIKWGIAMFSPGCNPIRNMANALAARNVLNSDIKTEPNSNKIEEVLRRSSMGLVNCVKERSETLKGKNIILVINQFEELFSLMNDDTKKNEARDFVKLLLRAVKEKERSIYVLMSIESDMMSEVTKFRGLPEVINQGQFLMPRMTKQDLREVIVKPLRKVDLPINEKLRGIILDEIGNTDDQLPVLEHALMRTVEKWEIAKEIAIQNNEELNSIEREHYGSIGDYSEELIADFEDKWQTYQHEIPIQSTLNIYEIEEQLYKTHRNKDNVDVYVAQLINAYQFQQEREYYKGLKPMEKALGVHAEEVYAKIPLEQKKVCELIFKAITDGVKGIDNVKTRPVEVSTLAKIAEVDIDEVKEILRIFIENGCNFMQSNQRDLRGSTTITLTHGSLVRRWNRLKTWVNEENESSKTYMRLANDAVIHSATPEKQGLWRDNQLNFGETWFNQTNPNSTWAMRYHPGYDTAILFLEQSIAKRDAELAKAKAAEEREKRRRRMILWIVSIAALVCLGLATWAYFESQAATRSADKAFKKELEASLSAKEARNEKIKAGNSERKAQKQAIIAQRESEKAEKSAKEANKALLKAKEEERKANTAAETARKERKNAEEARIAADTASAIADRAKIVAVQRAEDALIAERKAQKLKLQSLAEATAIKSKRIENRSQVQGQIAMKAIEIFQASDNLSEDEIYNPAIYEGLYAGIKSIKNKNGNNGFNKAVKHNGTIHVITKGNNAFYTAGSDGNILKWDMGKGQGVDKPIGVEPTTIYKRGETILSMAVSGNRLVTGGKDSRLAIYNLGSSDKPTEVNAHSNNFVWKVAFAGTKKDKIISTGQDKKVCLTDITAAKNNQPSEVIFRSPVNIKELDVHVNGQLVVLGATNGRISVININKPNEEQYSAIIKSAVSAVKYSPNGKYIAVGDVDGKLHIYDATLGNHKEYEAHNLIITDVEFVGNSGLVTTSRDKTAKYWHFNKLSDKNYAPFSFDDHDDWCTSANFNGQQAIIGCKDGSLKFWSLNLSTLTNELCGLLTNKVITEKDWDKYIGDDAELEKAVKKSTCQ